MKGLLERLVRKLKDRHSGEKITREQVTIGEKASEELN
jgi:hypothetical protein